MGWFDHDALMGWFFLDYIQDAFLWDIFIYVQGEMG
jgi:hypothetical protein